MTSALNSLAEFIDFSEWAEHVLDLGLPAWGWPKSVAPGDDVQFDRLHAIACSLRAATAYWKVATTFEPFVIAADTGSAAIAEVTIHDKREGVCWLQAGPTAHTVVASVIGAMREEMNDAIEDSFLPDAARVALRAGRTPTAEERGNSEDTLEREIPWPIAPPIDSDELVRLKARHRRERVMTLASLGYPLGKPADAPRLVTLEEIAEVAGVNDTSLSAKFKRTLGPAVVTAHRGRKGLYPREAAIVALREHYSHRQIPPTF